MTISLEELEVLTTTTTPTVRNSTISHEDDNVTYPLGIDGGKLVACSSSKWYY